MTAKSTKSKTNRKKTGTTSKKSTSNKKTTKKNTKKSLHNYLRISGRLEPLKLDGDMSPVGQLAIRLIVRITINKPETKRAIAAGVTLVPGRYQDVKYFQHKGIKPERN